MVIPIIENAAVKAIFFFLKAITHPILFETFSLFNIIHSRVVIYITGAIGIIYI